MGQRKVLVTEAGHRLNSDALSPYLRQVAPADLVGASGLGISLGPVLSGTQGIPTRAGRVHIPGGREMVVVFQARRDAYRNRIRWYAVCGGCLGLRAILYLEQGPIPLCARCARIAFLGERVPPSRRAAVRAIRDSISDGNNSEWIRLAWTQRKALAQRVARALKRQKRTREQLREGCGKDVLPKLGAEFGGKQW